MNIDKQFLMNFAEVVDAWRLFPRLFMLIYLKILWDLHAWYMHLSTPAYPDFYVSAVWAAMTAITMFYVNSGRKWSSG